MQDQVARHLEQKIAEKENTGAEAVDGVAPFQVVQHLQLGKADVDAVQVRAQIAEHQERDETARHLGIGAGFEIGGDSSWHSAVRAKTHRCVGFHKSLLRFGCTFQTSCVTTRGSVHANRG